MLQMVLCEVFDGLELDDDQVAHDEIQPKRRCEGAVLVAERNRDLCRFLIDVLAKPGSQLAVDLDGCKPLSTSPGGGCS